MSTYNGERYLREQIESILGQQEVELQLIVRDDGSSDMTTSILEEYAQAGKLRWKRGEQNLGPARSFLALLQEAPEVDYYAFADQDDVWNPDKLALSIQMLEQHANGRAAVVHTDLTVTDSSLRIIHSSFWAMSHIVPEKIRCLKEDVRALATGCTMVLNPQAREITLSRSADTITMHDAWIVAAVYSCGGQVLALSTPTLRYRQHGNNTLGAPTANQYSLRYHLSHIKKTLCANYKHYQMLRTWGYPRMLTFVYQKLRLL